MDIQELSIKDISKERLIGTGFRQAFYEENCFEILLSQIESNTPLNEHNHPHIQFGYCFSGNFIFNADGREYPLFSGNSYVLNSEIFHSANSKEKFYALDFKYIGHPESMVVPIKFNVFSPFCEIKKRGGKLEIAVICGCSLFKIKGAGSYFTSDFLKQGYSYYAVVSHSVKIILNGDSILLEPMKIYKLDLQAGSFFNTPSSEYEIIIIEVPRGEL